MANNVELSVHSQLQKVIDELQKITVKAKATSDTIKKAGKAVGDATRDQTKRTEDQVGKSTNLMRRMLDHLKSDLKSLASINAVGASLKLSNMFAGSITETISLGDAIRRLGPTFGIAAKDFSAFQSRLSKGMGDIGLSSESATKALEGLAETPVRGQKNLEEYAKTAGMLASVGGQKGQEGGIAKGMAGLIQARGGNVNDLSQMKSIAEDLRRVQNATGKGPSETIGSMQELFTTMSADFRKTMSTRTLANVAASAQVAGPNATKFLEQYLQMGKTQRAGLEARGVGNLIGNNGINTNGVKQFYNEAKKLGQGDIRLGLSALGVDSDEAAEGFTRLAEHLDEVNAAQQKVANSTGDLNSQYRSSLGLGDAFKANINKVKGWTSMVTAPITQGLTDVFNATSKSSIGSAAVVGGGGILAAALAGGGIRGLLGKQAIEAGTGKEVQNVYVVNAKDIGGGGMSAGSLLGKAGMVGGVGVAAYGVGTLLEQQINKHTQGTYSDGYQGNAVERIIFGLNKILGTQAAKNIERANKVVVELNTPQLKYKKVNSRGAAQ